MPATKETIEDWATRILLHSHAIVACPDCGFMRLKFGPRSLDYAHALAEFERYPGKSKANCIEAIDAAFDSLGDECPGC
jgi:hypothetical protein